MTQTFETPTLPTQSRPLPIGALPILISVPKLTAHVRGPRPCGRRRLRREVRVAACALLALLPVSMALVAFAGNRLPTLAAGLTIAGPDEATPRPTAVISLEPLEPVVVTVRRELEPPVILPGILLPVDTTEESSDGGH
jgi:hypothetical protein